MALKARPNGSLVLTVRLTLVPGRDEDTMDGAQHLDLFIAQGCRIEAGR